MDSLSITVVGSRHPISVPSSRWPPSSHTSVDDVQMRSPSLSSSISTSPSTRSQVASSSSRSRRKPLRTFKSPSSQDLTGLRVEGDSDSTILHSSLTRTSFSHFDGLDANLSRIQHTKPPLPLYHPLGRLALSVPELDPGLFGLPNPVNIDDHDTPMDADSVRRSSSRARRPAAKLRDRERDAGEEYVSAAITSQQVAASIPVTNGAKVPEVTPTSPRKRRGAGGGGRRKRRETDDGDGAYPNPPKRARNPRGGVIAVASPLAGPALAAATPQPQESLVETEDQGELDNASVAADVEDARTQDQRRSTRSRKSRTAAPTWKRRSSSASETTATSVSVSIAVNARSTRSAAGKASEEATGSNSSDKILETTGGDTERRTSSLDPNETLPQAGEDVRMEIADEKSVVDGEAEGSQENDVTSIVPQEESVEGPTEPVDTPGDANGPSAEPLADAVPTPVPEQIEAKAEEKSPVIPGSGSARVILGPVAVQNSKKATRDEEKEEGELSEEITPPPKSRQPSSAI